VAVPTAVVEMLCVASVVELTDSELTPEPVILGEGVGLPVVTDGLINGVCESVVQVVGLTDREPVGEYDVAAVFELLLLAEAEALEERSPERVFEPRADALRLLWPDEVLETLIDRVPVPEAVDVVEAVLLCVDV
jgi:hypothetical protein